MDQFALSDRLTDAVRALADVTHSYSDSDLGQPYQWGAHQEGVRFALLGAMHELRALAVHLAAERRRFGPSLTRAHHTLAQYNAACRDLEAALLGVSDVDYDAEPAPGEWPLRTVHYHMVRADRNFFSIVHYGLRRQREGGDLDATYPGSEADRLFGPVEQVADIWKSGTMREMSAFHETIRRRALAELADISDAELEGPSVWWEGEPYTLQYRIHRMDAHLRQHTIQVDKTRDQLGQPATEARRLLRLVYGALAEAEGQLIGSAEWEPTAVHATAQSITRLAETARQAVEDAHALIAAVASGDRVRVAELVAAEPLAANAVSPDGVPVVRLAVYYGQKEIAETLADSPLIQMTAWDGAALGRLGPVRQELEGWVDSVLNEHSSDGYTPLQLACFFGNVDVAQFLVERGADVHAVSRNPMAIRPLHAAVAGSHIDIARLLLAAGADPNTEQQDGFRPLHSAAQNGNAELVRLLLAHGADPAQTDAKGRSPRALAEEEGHAAVFELLTP